MTMGRYARKIIGFAATVPILFSLGQPASATGIDFVQDLGNLGAVFVASPNLTITARGNVDPADDLNPNADGLESDSDDNTIVLSPDTGNTEKGMGVQEPDGSSGSTGVSGKGHEENEELIFTFQDSVLMSSLVIGLSDIDFGEGGDKHTDDPFLYLFIDRLNSYTVFGPAEIGSAFSFLGDDPTTLEGTLSFVDLGLVAAGLFSSDTVSSFKLRNSADELWVTTLEYTVVPLPGALSLFAGALGLLGLLGWRGNRRTPSHWPDRSWEFRGQYT